MVRPAGVEPATIRVGGGDSIHLSYGRLSVWHARKELNPQPSALEAPALPIELPTYNLAETVGFEPTCRVNDAFLSREAFSATQARLHIRNDVVVCVWCRPPESNRFLRVFSAPYAPAIPERQ